jgi:hypothetical protein
MKAKRAGGYGSRGSAPVKQAQGPEFKLQYCQEKGQAQRAGYYMISYMESKKVKLKETWVEWWLPGARGRGE